MFARAVPRLGKRLASVAIPALLFTPLVTASIPRSAHAASTTHRVTQSIGAGQRTAGVAVDPGDGTVAVAGPFAADVRVYRRTSAVNRE